MSDHFYTIDDNERNRAAQYYGYEFEGVQCFVLAQQPPGPTAFYRALNPRSGDHFYTINVYERDNAVNNLGYRAEGIACYVQGTLQPSYIPLYRLYSPSTGDHFYTTDAAEKSNALSMFGYTDEGIACFVCPTQIPGTVPFYRLYKAYDHYLDINLICVASDAWSATDWNEITQALAVARNIYRQVGLSVRNVLWYTIPSSQAGGYSTIDNGGEAEDLTQDWTVPNGALDVFVVLTMINADGRSAVDGSCDKNSKGMSGSVVSLNGGTANVGNTLAHEMGHYLGLSHVKDSGNFIGGDGASDSWTGIHSWQGDTMKKHCFVNHF